MDMQKRNRLRDIENKLVVPKDREKRGRANEVLDKQIQTAIYKINKIILYSTENYTCYLVVTYNGV